MAIQGGYLVPRRVTFAVVLLLASMAVARVAAGELPGADESKLIALENAWNQAQLQHNANALQELVSDAFVYTDYDGTVLNKAGFMADLKDPNYRAVLITNQNVRVIPYQGLAIVIGTYHTKGTYKGRPFEHWGRFTDTWIYSGYKWQCVASHTNLITNKK
jgi:Domain of unknown function (DUF4440)